MLQQVDVELVLTLTFKHSSIIYKSFKSFVFEILQLA